MAPHQVTNLIADWWSTGWVRVGPPFCPPSPSLLPPAVRARWLVTPATVLAYIAVYYADTGQESRVPASELASQHRYLVRQGEDLRQQGRAAAGQSPQPADYPDHHQVKQVRTPMIADVNRELIAAYGGSQPNRCSVRSSDNPCTSLPPAASGTRRATCCAKRKCSPRGRSTSATYSLVFENASVIRARSSSRRPLPSLIFLSGSATRVMVGASAVALVTR